MVVLIIFPVILQTVINFRMLSIGRQGESSKLKPPQKAQLRLIYATPFIFLNFHVQWLDIWN